jgi:hypothetical protein
LDAWAQVIWRQFGAALDMLENAIVACPDSLWDDGSKPPELFWYSAYHCLFYVDHYLSEREEGYAPPPPFGLSEFDASGAMPERTYSKAELLAFLAHGRAKGRDRLARLTPEDATRRCAWKHRELTVAELHLYNLRHVQHHAAQLNLLLRQRLGVAMPWVSKARPD